MWEIYWLILKVKLLNLLFVEHMYPLRVFCVPQSVQEVKFKDSLKPLVLFE